MQVNGNDITKLSNPATVKLIKAQPDVVRITVVRPMDGISGSSQQTRVSVPELIKLESPQLVGSAQSNKSAQPYKPEELSELAKIPKSSGIPAPSPESLMLSEPLKPETAELSELLKPPEPPSLTAPETDSSVNRVIDGEQFTAANTRTATFENEDKESDNTDGAALSDNDTSETCRAEVVPTVVHQAPLVSVNDREPLDMTDGVRVQFTSPDLPVAVNNSELGEETTPLRSSVLAEDSAALNDVVDASESWPQAVPTREVRITLSE